LVEKGLMTDAKNSVENADYMRRLQMEPPFRDDTDELRQRKIATQWGPGYSKLYSQMPARGDWEAAHPWVVERLEQARQDDEDRYIEFAQHKAKSDWPNRYAPQLDEVEMRKFISELEGISKKCKLEAHKRGAPHIRWLKSSRLLHAFDVCDQDDPPSGEALKSNVFQCIFGMEGSTEAEGVLTEWATATKITRGNLFLRAFTRDQNGVKKETDKTLAELTQKAKGTKEFSAMPATNWKSGIKGLVSAVKSTDSALDEWMRNQDQSRNYLNPKHIANVEARGFYFISTITRSVARKGMGGRIETALLARANALLVSLLGDLAIKLEHDILDGRVDQVKLDEIKQKYEHAEAQAKEVEARKTARQKYIYRIAQQAKAELENAAIDLIADAQCKAKLHIANGAKSLGWSAIQTEMEESAKRHRNYKSVEKELKGKWILSEKIPSEPSPTNNYHHVRLGAVLASIEGLALYSKASALEETGWNMATAEVIASALSLVSIPLDMMYSYTKSVRELPHYAAIDGIKDGADIVRGGFKLAAGLLSAFAGGITAFSDWQKSKKETDSYLIAIYRVRSVQGAGSTIFGALAAYSYSAPLLNHLAKQEGRSMITSRASTFFAKGASFLSERVLLLRIVAWFGWIGVAITVVDLAYAGYRWYVDYTALTRWLSRCAFRKVKTNECFSTFTEELEELQKAQHPQKTNPEPKMKRA
jgi:hypothetical protein